MQWPHHATAASAVRRRSPTAPQIITAAVTTLLLLLLSLSVLYSRLLLSQDSNPSSSSLYLQSTPLDNDADNDAFDGPPDDDRIDVLDDLLDLPDKPPLDEEPDEPDDSEEDPQFFSRPESESETSSLLFFDHALSAHRLSFAKPHQNPDFLLLPLDLDLTAKKKKKISISFSSDDQPVDDGVKSKLSSIGTIEDALMVRSDGNSNNNSPMREGWARWLEGKGDFLRRDKMLRSNLEMLNPKNHILIQDPDVDGSGGGGGYTRRDTVVQRSILKEMEKVSFPVGKGREVGVCVRRSLQSEERRRLGYFEGIEEGLPFTEFVERLFETGRWCGIRVFMVWNSLSWMFGVRHQRGLESLLKVHGDACVLVLSETEMDFFVSFVKGSRLQLPCLIWISF